MAHRPELHQRGVRPGPRASRGGRAGRGRRRARLGADDLHPVRARPGRGGGTAVRGRPPAELSAAELVAAGDRLTALDLDAERRDRLAAEVLEAALDWLLAGPGAAQGGSLLGAPLTETALRRLLEATYRELARRTRDRDECRRLVDSANAVRPRTLL
nr:tetratricopeptide repeat protein [Actinomadura sp. BRA 177]